MKIKPLSLVVLLSSSASLVSAQGIPSIVGTWRVHTVIIQESDVTCSFTQKGAEVKGTCSGEHNRFNVTGKIEDDKIRWHYKTEYNGVLLTITYEGSLDSDLRISGSARVAEMDLAGDFVATKDTAALREGGVFR